MEEGAASGAAGPSGAAEGAAGTEAAAAAAAREKGKAKAAEGGGDTTEACLEIVQRFSMAVRTFYMALGRSLVVSLRRRDAEPATPCPTAWVTSAALMKVLVGGLAWRPPC
eukprot:4897276-Pyramimonas_sp.AAC.1